MTIEEVLKIYDSGYQICRELGIHRNNYTNWKKKGHIPFVQQLNIEKLTNGKLKAEPIKRKKRSK